MTHTRRHSEQLAGLDVDRSIVEINGEHTFNDEECFVRIGMQVPEIWAVHDTQMNIVVVHAGQNPICVALKCATRERTNVDRLDHVVSREAPLD